MRFLDFLSKNGNKFDNFSFKVSYSRYKEIAHLLRGNGFKTSLGTEVFVPGSDLEYYKVTFKQTLSLK